MKHWHLVIAFFLSFSSQALAVFQPGEEIHYEGSYLGLLKGAASIKIGQPRGDTWPVTFEMGTAGALNWLNKTKVQERLVVYWDMEDLLSHGTDLYANEAGDIHTDQSRFDRANGLATVVVERKNRKKTKTVEIGADVQDVPGAFLWLRMQRLEPGDRYEVPVMTGTRSFMLVATIERRETVKTSSGRYSALRARIKTDLEGDFVTKRDTIIWFTDDMRHVPVKISADFVVGSIVISMKKYRPGAPFLAD